MHGVWEELGTDFAESPAVLIGNVDCTQHQSVCSDHGVRGYPTLMYFKAGSKEPERYSGGRSKEALKSFVEGKIA
jgi:thioredoxin-like negative regulator of GroEL